MFFKFFRRSRKILPIRQELVCCICRDKYKVDLPITESLLKCFCYKCTIKIVGKDKLEFEYSGSSYWHSLDKKYLIICQSVYQKTKYSVYWRLNEETGWNLLEHEDDFLAAVLFANKNSEFLDKSTGIK